MSPYDAYRLRRLLWVTTVTLALAIIVNVFTIYLHSAAPQVSPQGYTGIEQWQMQR